MNCPPKGLYRSRRITPGQIRILQTLWSSRMRRARTGLRGEGSRAARLRHIAEIVGHEKGDKVKVLKYKNKTRYRKLSGQRQHSTKIKIVKIEA